MKKEQVLYGSIALLLLVIVINSAKPLTLVEIQEDSEQKSFDASILPLQLKPPVRLDDGMPLPQSNLPKKNFVNSYFKPRFDR